MMQQSPKSTRALESWKVVMHPELVAAVKKARGTEPEPSATEEAWPTLDKAAYHGLVGDVVTTISPHSEADSVALLVQTLAFFGNIVGRSPHYRVEGDFHRANIDAVLVGNSSKARKGTSAGRVLSVVKPADEQWGNSRIKSGLSSGEGLIYEVRDEVKIWNTKTEQYETIDPGTTDKRLLILEPEFANALAVMERPGNNLSPIIRNAWDGLPLSTLTKNSPIKSTGAHISIIGHITTAELRARINRTDVVNGFANRFLFICVRRSKLLPHGGSLSNEEIVKLGERVKKAADAARAIGHVTMTGNAREEWETIYEGLSAEQSGLLGAVTARAEAQTIRLALIYALLDCKNQIDTAHLRAALAVWEFCEASTARIFGGALGDPVADEIERSLRQAGSTGMTRTAIRDLFGRNKSGDRIAAALDLLQSDGRARVKTQATTGRSSEIWFHAEIISKQGLRAQGDAW